MIWPNDLELGHYNGFVLNAFSFDIALMGKGYAQKCDAGCPDFCVSCLLEQSNANNLYKEVGGPE